MRYAYWLEVCSPSPDEGETEWKRQPKKVSREWGHGYLEAMRSISGPAIRLFREPTGLCCGSDDCPIRSKALKQRGPVDEVPAR